MFQITSYDFKLGRFTLSNGAMSGEYGWCTDCCNPNTSKSSYLFLVVLLWGVLSWCKTTFLIWAAKYGGLFHNAYMRSRRTI